MTPPATLLCLSLVRRDGVTPFTAAVNINSFGARPVWSPVDAAVRVSLGVLIPDGAVIHATAQSAEGERLMCRVHRRVTDLDVSFCKAPVLASFELANVLPADVVRLDILIHTSGAQ